jgi:hypothetical protein
MGCLSSKATYTAEKKAAAGEGAGGEGEDGGEGGGDENMEFGNPLQGGKGGSRKKVTWKPAQEQSEEDMRRVSRARGGGAR